MTEVELGKQLPQLKPGEGEFGVPYGSAQVLARLHGMPLGFAVVDLKSPVSPTDLAAAIWSQLGEEVRNHLESDGLPAPDSLSPAGIASPKTPPCKQAAAAFLATAPFVTVVVPTRNRPDSVLRTVAGIAASSYPADRYEVVVVDNGSGGDELVDPAAFDAIDPQVRVVREPAAGGSNARNRGLLKAGGEIVICADDDIDPDPDWLATMVRPFVEDSRVGGVAGLTVPNGLETPAQLWFEGFGGFMRGFERRVYDIADPPPDRPLFPFTVGDLGSGQNMAFRRDALRELGGFDPALGTATPTLAGEDLEAMLRVLLAGHRVVYEPAAIVRHEHQHEFEQFRRRVWGYGVGLTACLTKAVTTNPRLLLTLVHKLPRGLAYALSPGSAKNENKQLDYPASLSRLELRGMAYGPIAYARSRYLMRGGRRSAAPRDADSASVDESGPKSPQKLRVLIVTDSHPPLIGGANRSVELLTRHLAARGHTLAVATAWQEGLPEVESTAAGEVHRIRDLSSRARRLSDDPYKHNPPPFPDPEAVTALRRLIRDFHPDLVHAYGWLAHSAAAALGRKRLPLLLSARDYGNVCALRTLVRQGELCSGPAPAKCLACATGHYGAAKGPVAAASVIGVGPLLRRRTTAVHSVSHFVAAQMKRFLHVEHALEAVIPNFYEEVGGQPLDEGALARLPEEPFVLYVGAFRKIKGIEELVAAYRMLGADAPPLVIVGTQAPDTPAGFPPAEATVLEDVPHATVMAIWERALFGVLPDQGARGARKRRARGDEQGQADDRHPPGRPRGPDRGRRDRTPGSRRGRGRPRFGHAAADRRARDP